MRILGNLFRFFTVLVLISLFYLVNKGEIGSVFILKLSMLSVLSLAIFIGLDNYRENKYTSFKQEVLYIPNWIVVVTPITMATILGADNSFSLFQNTALVISLLFLALVVIKVSLYLLNFKRHYYIYIITLLFISQLYNASGNVFFYNLSFILLLGIMGECFLYSEYRHKRSIS